MHEQKYIYHTPDVCDAERLDKYLSRQLIDRGISRERVKQLILEGRVTVNGNPVKVPKQTVGSRAEIVVRVPDQTPSIHPEPGTLEVLYQDEDFAVINKPSDLTTHPCPSCPSGTLAQRLLHIFPELSSFGGERPGIVHRLDKDTSGLMVVALAQRARLYFTGLFSGRQVYKEYLAVVYGVPEQLEGEVSQSIGRHPGNKTMMGIIPGGRPAVSFWRVLYSDPAQKFSILGVRILTGRTHQIRVHMAYIGHPLVGDRLYTGPESVLPGYHLDKRYGLKKVVPSKRDIFSVRQAGALLQARRSLAALAIPRQLLHAWRLAFPPLEAQGEESDGVPLPDGIGVPDKRAKEQPGKHREEPSQYNQPGLFSFQCPPPPEFQNILEDMMMHMLPVVITGCPGCGKSTLLSRFQEMGYPVISADSCVAQLYRNGADGWYLLRQRYGERFTPPGASQVDKKTLGLAMRDDPQLRQDIEALLHPLVFQMIEDFWDKHAADTLAFAEIPLYFEAGSKKNWKSHDPVTVGVSCPVAVRQERLTRIRGWDVDTVQAICSWQWDETTKMAACDIVVENGETELCGSSGPPMQEQARQIAQDLLAERGKKARREYAAASTGWSGVR